MVKYKEYRIEEVLTWQSQKEIDPLKIPELTEKSETVYPFYGQATLNNGIISYLSLSDSVLNNPEGKPTILIHSNNQNIVYLETPFYLKDGHGATSVLQSEFLNEKIALYLISCIKKVILKKFSYNEKATKIALKNTYIQLPIDDNEEIDYAYMERVISNIEEKSLQELDSYLKSAELDDYTLSETECQALEKFNQSKVQYQAFKIGGENGLFSISSSKRKFNANSVKFDGKYPYVARSSNNNGIRGYINQNEMYLNDACTISFGQDTATIFYQEKPYFTGDKIKIMTYKEKALTPELACYLLTVMRKAFQNFAWGQTSFNEDILKDVEIQMPIVKPNEIDYNFIDIFIRAQYKNSIKDIVDWKNKTAANTRSAS